jgi:ubiquinone/menaquinone biosynthesis C-methylase UbiE
MVLLHKELRGHFMIMKFFRKFKDLGITGNFAKWYDKNSRENRLEEMKGYAKEVASHVQNGSSILEIAPGPGYLSIELAKMGNYKITGMDISADFVEICKNNARQANVNIDFQQGNVSEMPFNENVFDFIVCSAAFKNFKEPVVALKEMYRVLNANGKALILDMNRNVSKEILNEEASKISKTGFEKMFIKTTFEGLRKGAYTKEEFGKLIEKTSFSRYEIKEMGISLYVYLYK